MGEGGGAWLRTDLEVVEVVDFGVGGWDGDDDIILCGCC